jgi:hypothetical protein
MFELMNHSTSYICKELSIEDKLKKLIGKKVKVIYTLDDGMNYIIEGILCHWNSFPGVYTINSKAYDVTACFNIRTIDLILGKTICITQKYEPLGHGNVLHLI